MRGLIPCKNREQWLKMRKHYLTRALLNASDMAAYVGDSPYKTAYEAWLEKTGQKEPEDLSENVNILRGIEREPFIRQQIIEENESWAKFTYKQFDIYLLNLAEYALGATLDLEFEVTSEDNPYGFKVGEHGVWEIKSVKVTPQTFTEDRWISAPPVYYVEQQYAQLMCTGYNINILTAEFEREDEKGEVYYETRTYSPLRIQGKLFEDPNVKALHERLTKFSRCVDTMTAPDKNVQGTDAEIVFKADVVNLGSFYSNYEEVKSAIKLAVAPFKEMTITADNEKEGKAVRAQLNKAKKSIMDKCKEVCAVWDAPKLEFVAKCKDIAKEVDDAALTVDSSLKEIENNRIKNKKKDIEEIRSNVISELFLNQSSLLDYFNQCGGVTYDVRWENRGTSDSAIKKDIQNQIGNFKADFASMEVFNADKELYNAMLMAYKRTHSLSDALKTKTELENAREIAKRAQAEKVVEPAPEPVRSEPIPEPTPIKAQPTFPSSEQKYTIGFEVYHVSKAQLAELSSYLKGNGISYKRTNVVKETN